MLVMIAGSLSISPEIISFQCEGDAKTIPCTIMHETLQDLADFHGVSGGEAEVFNELRSEILRLATAKFRAGRFGPEGQLTLGAADVLRYGFEDIFGRKVEDSSDSSASSEL